MNLKQSRRPTVKSANMAFPRGDVTRACVVLRMTDMSSRLLDTGCRVGDRFLNSLIGETDEELSKRFRGSFRGWRKPQ